MLDTTLQTGSIVLLPKQELDTLLLELRENGFITVGPSVQDESIVYREVISSNDLPNGIASDQSPSAYRLIRTGKNRIFDFIPGSQSWKQYLFPPSHTLFQVTQGGNSWSVQTNDISVQRYALIGVRACEMAAILIQDRIFLRSDFSDPLYRSRREGLFIVAVNCLEPNATCFCTSLGTGPQVRAGFDLCLTELDDHFLIEIGSELGRSMISQCKFSLPSGFMQNIASQAIARSSASITRVLDTQELPKLLHESLESDRWNDVGKRCLSCGNCTLVCPTCFCWEVVDKVDISSKKTSRERIWDSCFNINYSYVFGGNTRPNIRSRYRQWLTHKLGTWVEQFGVSGCVGCGRCITWCPAAIDLTVEIDALRQEVNR